LHQVRRQLVELLDELSRGLPEDLRMALSAGLALHEDVRHRFLEERMQWLATKLKRDVRTARRRVDEAILAIEALAAQIPIAHESYVPGGWYLGCFRTVLRMDMDQVTAIEERKIVSSSDDLSEIVISTSVPRTEVGDGDHRVSFSVLYGGTLDRHEQTSETYFRYHIRLPRTLKLGESHDLGVALTIPSGQPMNPRYSFQPLRRCDEFDLRIRFGLASQIRRIWVMAGVPKGMADDFMEPDSLIPVDNAGEIHLKFQHLRTGLVYGARWEGTESG
jgi:hypothetical protein